MNNSVCSGMAAGNFTSRRLTSHFMARQWQAAVLRTGSLHGGAKLRCSTFQTIKNYIEEFVFVCSCKATELISVTRWWLKGDEK